LPYTGEVLIGKKSIANAVSEVVSAENAQTTDTDTATSKENLSVPQAEGSSSVNIRTNPSPSVQTPSATAASVEQVGEQVDKPTLSDKMRGKGKKETSVPSVPSVPSAEKSAPEKIEDYGEKIGGARKDQYKQAVQSHLEDDLSDEEIYNLPASKVFPIPDYAKLAEQGVLKKSLALLKALREAFFPNKPTTRFKSKVGKYVKSIKDLRSWAVDILKNADAWEKDIVAKNAEADKILKEISKWCHSIYLNDRQFVTCKLFSLGIFA